MANHASHAALPYPVKGARFTVLIPYLDADGDPTDPTTPDTEISKDDGAAADTAEEVSSPKNSVGMLTLTGAEMDCSCASLAAKAASGPKTTLATLYPRVLPAIFSGTAQAGASGSITVATDVPAIADLLVGCIVKTTGGTGGGGTGGANNQARVITDFTTGRVASVTPNWETTPSTDTTYEILMTEAAIMRYSDLQLWRGSQPNALQSGRVDSYLGAAAAGVIAAATFAANALDAVWSTATRVLTAGTNIVLAKGTGVTGFNDLSAAQVNAEADTALADVGVTTTVTGRIDAAISSRLASGSYTAPPSAASIASAVWDSLTSALTTASSIGKLLVDNINATISSRLASASYTAPPTAAAIADQVWEETLADHSGTSGSTAAALNAAGSAGDPWNTALPGSYGSGTAGKIIGDNLNATVSSRAPESGGNVAAIKAKTDNLPSSPAATGDAMALTSSERTTLAGVIWDRLTSAITTVGSIGKLLKDNVDAAISSRSSHAAADVWAVGTRTLTSFGTLAADVGTAVWAAGTRTLSAFGFTVDTNANATETAIKAKTDNLPADPADASDIAASFATVNSNIATVAGYVDAEVAAIYNRIGAPVGASLSADLQALLTTAVADSVPADGSRPSVAQGIYLLTQFMLEREVSGTSMTVKKPDGTTALITLTLNDATSPTAITRAS